MLVFLALNGIELDDTQDELADTFLDIAAGQRPLDELLGWIIDYQI
jgi:death-on-curing protein